MKSVLSIVLGLVVGLTVSCSKIPVAPTPSSQDVNGIPDFEKLIPTSDSSGAFPVQSPTTNAFQNTLAEQGVFLSGQEIQSLRQMIQTKPNGQWALSKGKSEAENLQANFERFGKQFKPPLTSADGYKKAAITFASKTEMSSYLDLDYYRSTEKLLAVKWDSKSGEFIIIRSDGTLANYLITHSVQPPRYVEITL